MLEGRAPLTVDSLKKLKVRLKVHLNGGSKFSSRTDDNEDYGVCVTVETNGSPQYKVTSQMADFVEAYNTAYGLK